MRPMTNDVRKKIKQYVKNRIDISPLIKGVEIKGEDFSNAIITEFNRSGEDLSGINLSHTIIGEEGKVTNLSNCILRNSECIGTKFVGVVYLRKCDCRGSSFNGSWWHNVEYQYSDLRNCTFCDAIVRIGDYGFKAKLDPKFFKDFGKIVQMGYEDSTNISK